MIDLSQAVVKEMYTHYLANPLSEEDSTITQVPVPVTDEVESAALQYFLHGFSTELHYRFKNLDEEGRDTLWRMRLNGIFEGEEQLRKLQRPIAEKILNVSNHPKISNGYLHVVLIDQIVFDDEVMQAIGIFKSEESAHFAQFQMHEGRYVWNIQAGYPLSKLDKACLILDTEPEDGYVCLAIDRKQASGVADFWLKDFLNLEIRENEYHQTFEMINLARDFVSHEARAKHDITKPDEIEYLNRSQAFFKGNDHFNTPEYVDAVFNDRNLAESFQDFKDNRKLQNGEPIPDNFKISHEALKKQGKVFKSILKLDKNFHVYIHGDRSKIERGRDADGRKFYKIYYDREE